MPRANSGYDPAPVCAFCIDNLTSGLISSGFRVALICCAATAGSKNYLKSLSLGKLRKYADAYNLRSDQIIIEKDDLVDRLMSYRVSLAASIGIPHQLISYAEMEWVSTSGERGTWFRDLSRLIVHTKPSWAGVLQEPFGPQFVHTS